MTVLITGSSGFVGLALAEHLLAQGEDVVGYDLAAPPHAALQVFRALPGQFHAVQGDVRDEAALCTALRDHRPQRLAVLAAITADAGRERAAPRSIFDVNVGGALATVAAAADCGVRDTPSAPLQVLRLAQQGIAAVLPRDSRRDWLYVRDAAAAIASLLESNWRHAIYNLAPGQEWSMAQWCERLARRQPGFAWRYAAGESANVDYYADYDRAPMDIARLRADTGFVPRYGLDEALDDFLAWWSSHGAISLARGGRDA